MATYYVDPAATGLNDGSSWTDAFTDLQAAIAVAAPKDVVYCRGTQTLTAPITYSCSGSLTLGLIDWIGCNASGVDDGTRFVLDGNSTVANCLNSDGGSYSRFKNFEIKGSTANGVDDATADSNACTFINCKFHLNGGTGFDGASWVNTTFFKCSFDNNGSYGAQSNYTGTNRYLLCTFRGNSNGYYQYINSAYSTFHFGCIFSDNTNYGANLAYGGWTIVNCVFDGNSASGITTDLSSCYRGTSLVGNRITNNGTYGIYDAAIGYFTGTVAYNYFNGNTNNDIGSYIAIDDAFIEDAGVETNLYTGIQGYVDATNGDYNLTADATMRRVAVTLPE